MSWRAYFDKHASEELKKKKKTAAQKKAWITKEFQLQSRPLSFTAQSPSLLEHLLLLLL